MPGSEEKKIAMEMERKLRNEEKAKDKEMKKQRALEKARSGEVFKSKPKTTIPEKKIGKDEQELVDPETPIGERKRLSSQMPKQYNPSAVEKSWYEWWEKSEFFKADAKSSKPSFVIILPPPNVTGELHIGHALTCAIEDTLIRWKRMSGFNTLWVPGFDHAGIATQKKVEDDLKHKTGMTRHDFGREKFLNHVWQWTHKSSNIIHTQLRRIGSSLDWSRECFTMDQQRSKAVTEAFVRLHKEGLIYRSDRIGHWDCFSRSARSDEEIDRVDIKGRTPMKVSGYEKPVEFGLMTSFAYPLESGGGEVVVATTRVETMLGDTAIAVHPDDERYKHLHGEIALRNLHNNPGINSIFNYLKHKLVRFPAEEKPKSAEITIPVEHFVPMTKLRLLQINNVDLEGNLKLLPSELKWIQWKGCPLENIPLDFLARQLAVLDLSESGIRQVQSFRSKRVDENLKVVKLRNCHSLEAIPDLSNHKALEKLVLERCKLLVKVPTSVGNLKTLLQLDLRNCSNLSEFLVDVSGLKLLEKLLLSGCSNLSVLPENIGAMPHLKELLLDGTAIKILPESIYRLENLVKLSLRGCRSIKQLPLCIGTLTSLEKLYLSNTALQSLPTSIGNLKNLQKLHLMHCPSLSKIPDTIDELKSLKELFLNGSALEELPVINPGSLPCLTDVSAGECKFLKEVPSSIGGLNSLLQLQLDSTPIQTLPKEIGGLHFIRKLELRNCKSMKFLPESIGDMDTLDSLNLSGSNIEKLPEGFGKLENLVVLRMDYCKMLKRLPESFGNLKSLHRLYMKETLVAELPESFGNLSNLMVLNMLKKPLFRISESDAPGRSEEPRFVEVPNSFSNLLLLEELDARSWGISGKIPDVLGKLSSVKILDLGNNYFHSLPSSLEGLSSLKKLLLYDCRELKCLPPLPWKLEKLILANCFSLESISDLSNLEILDELNLTNCEKVVDIPGLEHLTDMKRLYMSGCNSTCSLAIKKRLSKASLKLLRNLSLPGNRIPDWFSQGPLTLSAQPNRDLTGVILAVVVAVNHETEGDYQLPDVLEIQAQILKLDHASYTHTLHISGVPRTSNDQLHICRYPALHPMLMALKDGYTIQVIKREPPIKQGVQLKMHGIYLVYEGDDDFKGDEQLLSETQLTVSQKLANFFRTFDEGEASSESESTVT